MNELNLFECCKNYEQNIYFSNKEELCRNYEQNVYFSNKEELCRNLGRNSWKIGDNIGSILEG